MRLPPRIPHAITHLPPVPTIADTARRATPAPQSRPAQLLSGVFNICIGALVFSAPEHAYEAAALGVASRTDRRLLWLYTGAQHAHRLARSDEYAQVAIEQLYDIERRVLVVSDAYRYTTALARAARRRCCTVILLGPEDDPRAATVPIAVTGCSLYAQLWFLYFVLAFMEENTII